MKTITEFAAITLKNAAKSRDELTTAGKTTEELPAALGEALKVEGDKLTHLMNGLELVGTKHGDLKRVVVFTLAEGEKPPAQAQQKGENWYLVEYYPSLEKPRNAGGPRDGKGRDGKRGGGKGGKGGRGGPGRGGDRAAGGPGGPGGGGGRRPPRPPQANAGGPAKPVSLPKPKES
ncbi:MAG: hypothetical protein ACXWP5_02335 [Bdellovibrionota bacterium]